MNPPDSRLPERIWHKIEATGVFTQPFPVQSPECIDTDPSPRAWPRESPCWVWTGTTTGGYGAVHWQQRMVYVHRLMYSELVGPIPPRTVLDHLCRNNACVNPGHLEAVTHSENLRRGGRGPSPKACIHGHEFTPENVYVNPRGATVCRQCNRLAQARFQARRKIASGRS